MCDINGMRLVHSGRGRVALLCRPSAELQGLSRLFASSDEVSMICVSKHRICLLCFRCVVIEKCSHCVIVLGAVERCVSLNHCTGICLVTACRRVMIR